MAKYLVRANTYGNQVRISIPVPMIKQMGWKDAKFFVVEKLNHEEIKVRKFYGGKDFS